MPRPITEINAQHLDQIRAWHDGQPGKLNWASVGYRAMLAHYYNLLIPSDASVLEIGCGSGELLKRIRAKRKGRNRPFRETGIPREGSLPRR
jgi:SAM-dependent methyltransferase